MTKNFLKSGYEFLDFQEELPACLRMWAQAHPGPSSGTSDIEEFWPWCLNKFSSTGKSPFSVSLRIHSAQLCTEACWPEISWGWEAGEDHWAGELQSPRSGGKSLTASFSFVIPFTNVNGCKLSSILFTCHTSFSLYRKVVKHFFNASEPHSFVLWAN